VVRRLGLTGGLGGVGKGKKFKNIISAGQELGWNKGKQSPKKTFPSPGRLKRSEKVKLRRRGSMIGVRIFHNGGRQ